MNTKAFFSILKQTRWRFLFWAAVAALCVCVGIVAGIFVGRYRRAREVTPGWRPPQFAVDGRSFLLSSYGKGTDELPEGFSKAGETEITHHGLCRYYTNPEIPEWVYVLHTYSGDAGFEYVRYVDTALHSRSLLSRGDEMYISLNTVNLFDTEDISREYYESVWSKYGPRIEGEVPKGFELAGVAEFTGYERVPSGELAMNTDAAEVYLNEAQPEIALVATEWHTASENGDGLHRGYNVYVRYDCPFEN